MAPCAPSNLRTVFFLNKINFRVIFFLGLGSCRTFFTDELLWCYYGFQQSKNEKYTSTNRQALIYSASIKSLPYEPLCKFWILIGEHTFPYNFLTDISFNGATQHQLDYGWIYGLNTELRYTIWGLIQNCGPSSNSYFCPFA